MNKNVFQYHPHNTQIIEIFTVDKKNQFLHIHILYLGFNFQVNVHLFNIDLLHSENRQPYSSPVILHWDK